jgi:5-methylcytosine-specific restriction enzyme subunit McrC
MAEPRILLLDEWTPVAGVSLSHEEVRVLRESDAGIRVVATGRAGTYDLEPSSIVGTVVGPSLRVLIRPKVSIERLLFLLSQANEVPELTGPAVLDHAPDLLEAMQWLYGEALAAAMRQGLVFGYQPRAEALQAVRGRPDVERIVASRFGLVPPIDCLFDEYTADMEPNRRLLAAAELLARASTRNVATAETLRRLALRFEGVSPRRYGPRDAAPEYRDRRLAPFKTALALADLALRNASVELRNGRTDALAFVVDMDDVFERFAVAALRNALALRDDEWRHHPRGLRLDRRDEISVTPDVLWTDADGRRRLVVDVKYKRTSRGENADVYQMVAYCTALGLPAGVLLYAHADEECVHEIRNAGILVHVMALDPGGDLESLRNRIAGVAARLRQIAL